MIEDCCLLSTSNAGKQLSIVNRPHPSLPFQAPWKTIRDGSKSGPPCLQPDLMGGVLGSEDCLTLTIYTPQKPPQAPLPVMVWIPGGGFVVGGASKEDWDPEFFLDQVGAPSVFWSP